MTPDEIQKLKESLLKEKTSLEVELEKIATKNPEVKGDWKARFNKPEPDDTSDEKAHSITDYEEERAVEQNFENRLKEINETLEKIDKGTYGICDKCLSPIDQKRLKVLPIAKFCLECAKKSTLV